jgi:hypothetical protein
MLLALGFHITKTARRAVATAATLLFSHPNNQRKAYAVGWFRVGAAYSLVSVSRAGGFNEACGFATFLAGIRIFDELR